MKTMLHIYIYIL